MPTGNDMYNSTQYPVSTIVEILTTASEGWPQPPANSSCMLGRTWEYRPRVMVTLEWAVGFFFGNVGLSLELWTVMSGISGFDD